MEIGTAANADSITARERLAWLVSTIEGEIIPRLMLAHHASGPGSADQTPLVDAGTLEVEAFARLAMGSEAEAPATYVHALREAGASLESIYLGLLAPTARYLGELWEADLCDFTTVTAALWRLQHLMYDLSPEFQGDAENQVRKHHALLAPVPGSQHTFGLLMVAEFFRRGGWDVWTQPATTMFELVEAVHSEWFDLIGFSAATETQIEGLTSVILTLRKASCNPNLVVLVGGAAFVAQPHLVALVGADATALDAAQAIKQAERLVAATQAASYRTGIPS
jgi:methanogenic corrinoid protein MtbC1